MSLLPIRTVALRGGFEVNEVVGLEGRAGDPIPVLPERFAIQMDGTAKRLENWGRHITEQRPNLMLTVERLSVYDVSTVAPLAFTTMQVDDMRRLITGDQKPAVGQPITAKHQRTPGTGWVDPHAAGSVSIAVRSSSASS